MNKKMLTQQQDSQPMPVVLLELHEQLLKCALCWFLQDAIQSGALPLTVSHVVAAFESGLTGRLAMPVQGVTVGALGAALPAACTQRQCWVPCHAFDILWVVTLHLNVARNFAMKHHQGHAEAVPPQSRLHSRVCL